MVNHEMNANRKWPSKNIEIDGERGLFPLEPIHIQ